MKFISDVTVPSWPSKSANPSFRQYQSYRNIDKFACRLEIQSEVAGRISICTLYPLNYVQFKPMSGVRICQPPLFPITILQKQLEIYWLFQKLLKNSCNNLYFHFYTLWFFMLRHIPVLAR